MILCFICVRLGITRSLFMYFINNFNFLSKVRALDRFKDKLEGERSEPKIFINIFPHYNLLSNIFFYHFMNKLFFSPQVAEQTIYYPKFAEQSFFHKKTIALPQESNGRPLMLLITTKVIY